MLGCHNQQPKSRVMLVLIILMMLILKGMIIYGTDDIDENAEIEDIDYVTADGTGENKFRPRTQKQTPN